MLSSLLAISICKESMAKLVVVILLVAFGPFCFQCKPMGGRFSEQIFLDVADAMKQNMKVSQCVVCVCIVC